MFPLSRARYLVSGPPPHRSFDAARDAPFTHNNGNVFMPYTALHETIVQTEKDMGLERAQWEWHATRVERDAMGHVPLPPWVDGRRIPGIDAIIPDGHVPEW